MQIMRDFMITSDNSKSLIKSQQQREVDRGFTYAIQCQIWLDEMFSAIRTYNAMMNLYLKIVAFKTKLRVYYQYCVQEYCPSTYQTPPERFTIAYFDDCCADTLSILEQSKKYKKQHSVLRVMRTALNHILSTQQDMFNLLKTGKYWDELFEMIRLARKPQGGFDSSLDSSPSNVNTEE